MMWLAHSLRLVQARARPTQPTGAPAAALQPTARQTAPVPSARVNAGMVPRQAFRARVRLACGLTLAVTGLLLAGCGGKSPTHEPAEEATVVFEEGRGLKLPTETQKSLGVQTGQAGPQTLQLQTSVPVQVFDRYTNAAGRLCLLASGFVPATVTHRLDRASALAHFSARPGATLQGRVIRLDASAGAAFGQVEVLLELCGTSDVVPGSFGEARLDMGPVQAACAVPQSALVRAARGNFVYVAEAGYYKRVAVTVGTQDAHWVEIQSGLAPGTTVVTAGAEALWLLELNEVGGTANLK